jgi:uncharacterized protein
VKNSTLLAFCAPFGLFLLFLSLGDLCDQFGAGHSQYWLFPLQTVVCAGALALGWKSYGLSRPSGLGWALLAAVAAFAVWIAPQAVLGRPPRLDGFNPGVFPPGSPFYWGTVLFRFLRLVIVVPLLEEIFWRGFLLRYLVRADFLSVPVGTFTWGSFTLVTVAFTLEHAPADYPAALFTGAAYNLLAVKTRSLGACVLAHAITNLLLGLYIMYTRQWGFW